MVKNKILTVFISLLSLGSFAQYNLDFGFGIGAANYLGEMGGNEETGKPFVTDIKMSQTKLAPLSGYLRYRFHPNIAVNLTGTYATISGADSLSTNPARVGRNLHFKTQLIELAARGEYYFLSVNDVGGTGRYQVDFKAYGFIGIGATYFNPKQNIGGTWVPLRPLNTEQLAKPYSPFALVVPMGVGLYYTYKRVHRFGWEFGWRYTTTDYLDDVSTEIPDISQFNDPIAAIAAVRYEDNLNIGDLDPNNFTNAGSVRGNPDNKDSYFLMQFTYGYAIRGKRKFNRSRYGYVGGYKRKRRTRAKF